MFPFKSLGPPRTAKQPETDGLIRWASLGKSCLTSQEIGWGIQSHCTTDPGISNFNTHKFWEGVRVHLQQSLAYLPFQAPPPPVFCLNHLTSYLFLDSSHSQQIPVTGHWPTWKSACRFKNPGPFQVSVVATFITHKRDREPQLSTEPLVFTLLYLFVYWFCHSSHWSPGRVSLHHQVCEYSSFARKSHQI